ncbi:uncharacterized protein C7orf50 homolog isoform X2 [Sturnira hondurensis]|uniref:uncharacterized protein C7orf50 homolog isoform X2 n=1 Tax=Sturnira hondurensis TaxID=192404 RepID=UPI00187ADE59|nr:uncharacterized protein C7orf50 homolog isoform X2 [Sturnira hondurensis]
MTTGEKHPALVVVIAPAEGARVRGPARSAVRPRMAAQKRRVSGVPEKRGKKLKAAAAAAEAPVAREGAQASEQAPERDGVHSDPEPTQELTPEEKRVLERKLKKERRREARKRLREAGAAPAQPPRAQRSRAQLALDYLCGWARKQEDWRFQKTRQTWLLLHMYDGDQVPEEHFPALLAYLEGLKGRARELTLQKAESLMRELDQAGADHPDPPLRAKTRRVRQVLQLLS